MRTTVDLDEDILNLAKHLAQQQGVSAGQVISELARKALEPSSSPKIRNGVQVFVPKAGAKKPSLEVVNRLRDDE